MDMGVSNALAALQTIQLRALSKRIGSRYSFVVKCSA